MFSKGASIKNPQPAPCSLVEDGASLRDGDKVRVSVLALSAPHGTGPSWAIEQEIKGTRLERDKCSVFAEDMVLCKVLQRTWTLLPTPGSGLWLRSSFSWRSWGRAPAPPPRGVCSSLPTWGRGALTPGSGAKGMGARSALAGCGALDKLLDSPLPWFPGL